ncbi:hypothetical protein ACF0H5_019667 [Mactra antiquata]
MHHSVIRTLNVLCLLFVTSQAQECDNHCYPGQSCWPSPEEALALYKNIDGDVYSMYDEKYRAVNVMVNTRVQRLPALIVMAKNVDDVIYALNFANKFNMKITVRSSGHDYIGRSTWDGSLTINLFNMKGLDFDLSSNLHPAGTVKAESGNSWLRVYNETNKVGRVIVGGSAHTVSMGGYTLGGGHSPIGRKFGMAVDNLLEVDMVTTNGSFVRANENGTTFIDRKTGQETHSPNADIFWALRGGGGSTYGIVTAFTYKLHYDSEMVKLTCAIPYFDYKYTPIGRPFLQQFNNLLATNLAPEWGGYEIIVKGATPPNHGTIILVLNHFGGMDTPSYRTIQPFLTAYGFLCKKENMTNFLEYEITAHDDLYYRTYIFNALVQPQNLDNGFYTEIESLLNEKEFGGCTGTLIGGNMMNNPADNTAVNPNFRSGVMSLSCGVNAWGDPRQDRTMVAFGEQMTPRVVKLGKGVYFNEPSALLDDWKTQYWGGHYDRLLSIKKAWDPDNILTCFHCVGSDIKDLKNTDVGSNVPIIG